MTYRGCFKTRNQTPNFEFHLNLGFYETQTLFSQRPPTLSFSSPSRGDRGECPLALTRNAPCGLKSTPGSPPGSPATPRHSAPPRNAPHGLKSAPGSPGMPWMARGALLRPWEAFRGDAGCRGSPGMPRIARGALLRPRGAIRATLSAGNRRRCRGSPGVRF